MIKEFWLRISSLAPLSFVWSLFFLKPLLCATCFKLMVFFTLIIFVSYLNVSMYVDKCIYTHTHICMHVHTTCWVHICWWCVHGFNDDHYASSFLWILIWFGKDYSKYNKLPFNSQWNPGRLCRHSPYSASWILGL